MQLSTTIAAGISGTIFVWHGARCFVSRATAAEFERYQLPRYRVLTGALQIVGGTGLLVGSAYRPLLQLSAAGLATMMVLGAIVHVRIRDPWQAAMPALLLCAFNLFIAVAAA